MSELENLDLRQERRRWLAAGRPIPLEVSRSRYDDVTLSWEVLWWESPMDPTTGSGCMAPIAEFTTWREAQDWAAGVAAASPVLYRRDCRFGPLTRYRQAHVDAWAAYEAGTGPHPFTTERERLALL